MEGMVFDCPFHLDFQNCLSSPSPQDFQVHRPPLPPIRISIKLIDTVIFSYTHSLCLL